jgi:hypothetical protein
MVEVKIHHRLHDPLPRYDKVNTEYYSDGRNNFSPSSHLLDLLGRVAFCEINWDTTNFLRLGEPLRDTIDYIHRRSAAEASRVGSHKTYGASAEHGDRLSGKETLCPDDVSKI